MDSIIIFDVMLKEHNATYIWLDLGNEQLYIFHICEF